ncbi:protein translocase subunit SecF [Ideonella sp. B7]|uniref:protein translocase subunit SecF n=1 Tax=Ideonella benzenivorans TaxID=2831643 RepID=UPI001CEDF2C8|nr:protein translocase subunit SecF [Ideonella benzenivorans]MCA6217300.1 protein translocase subunit SecF [Ideonella benzenivorans]
MEFFRIRRDIPFMRYALVFNVISAVTFVAAVFFLFTRGLHLSNEFTGGTVLEVSYAQSADLGRVRGVVQQLGFGDVQVQNFGTSRDVMIRLPVSKDAKPQELATRVFTQLCLAENGTVADRQYTTPQGEQVSRKACEAGSAEPLTLSRTEFVGPSVGEELVWDGGKALIFVVLGIVGYLAIRFEKKFAVAAIIANLHDVVIILGFFAFFQWEFSLSVLAAVLAVLGYSVNESVVIFDRIREAFRKFRKMNTHEVIDHAITSTMSRTIITHGSTQMMVLSMLLFGGPTLHYFAVALTIGILFGIYSSVFVAAAIAMWLGVTRDDLVKGGGAGGKDADPSDPNTGAVV